MSSEDNALQKEEGSSHANEHEEPQPQSPHANQHEELESQSPHANEHEELEPQSPHANEHEELESQSPHANEHEELEPQSPHANEHEELESQSPHANEYKELEPESPRTNEYQEPEPGSSRANEYEKSEAVDLNTKEGFAVDGPSAKEDESFHPKEYEKHEAVDPNVQKSSTLDGPSTKEDVSSIITTNKEITSSASKDKLKKKKTKRSPSKGKSKGRRSKRSKKKKKQTKSDSEDSDETSTRSKKKKKKKTAEKDLPRTTESLPAVNNTVAILMFILDGIIVIVAVYLFATKPTCEVIQGGDVDEDQIDGDLSKLNKTNDQSFNKPPPPLNQFRPESESLADFGFGEKPIEYLSNANTEIPFSSYPPDSVDDFGDYYDPDEDGLTQTSSSNDSADDPETILSVLPTDPNTFIPFPFPVVEPIKPALVIIPEDNISDNNFQCGTGIKEPNLKPGASDNAVSYSWPWSVRMRKIDPKHGVTIPVCGATVVSPRHAISACRCIDTTKVDEELEYYRISVETLAFNSQNAYKVAKVRAHPTCQDHIESTDIYFHDILLLTLQKDVQFSYKVQPACLPSRDQVPAEKKNCWESGWNNEGGRFSRLKQYNVEIVPEKECMSRLSLHVTEPKLSVSFQKETAICTEKTKKTSSCPQENGGSLNCEKNGSWIFYGPRSWWFNCKIDSPSGSYAAISYALSWVCCFMKNIPSCQDVPCDY